MKVNGHCCAACKWFDIKKTKGEKIQYYCSRLNYETKPGYQFNCWDPKESVKKRLDEMGIEWRV